MSSRLARIIIVLPALIFGLGHLSNPAAMTEMVPDYFPAKTLLIYISGIGLVLGSISVIINKMARLGALLLAIEILMIAMFLFLPGLIEGDQLSLSSFLKDLGLAAAAYYVSANSEN